MARRKALEPETVIQLEGWDGWRIVGNGGAWQIQRLSGDVWNPRQSFPSLLSASLAAYDYALMGLGFEITSARELCGLCEGVLVRLTEEIGKAARNG